MGALHPYFPDTENPGRVSSSWKPSRDPPWAGAADYTWPLDKKPPHKNHRWLRVADDKMITQTPASSLKYEVWGESYTSWAIAAQMHYSFFENLESNSLHRYKFNKPWDMDGERIRINFMCVYADDILDTGVEHWPTDRSDEDMIVIDLPKKLRRREFRPVLVVNQDCG